MSGVSCSKRERKWRVRALTRAMQNSTEQGQDIGQESSGQQPTDHHNPVPQPTIHIGTDPSGRLKGVAVPQVPLATVRCTFTDKLEEQALAKSDTPQFWIEVFVLHDTCILTHRLLLHSSVTLRP